MPDLVRNLVRLIFKYVSIILDTFFFQFRNFIPDTESYKADATWNTLKIVSQMSPLLLYFSQLEFHVSHSTFYSFHLSRFPRSDVR